MANNDPTDLTQLAEAVNKGWSTGPIANAAKAVLEADIIEMCEAHFHRGDLMHEDDYPLISYCPSGEFRGSCHIVTAVVVRVKGPND